MALTHSPSIKFKLIPESGQVSLSCPGLDVSNETPCPVDGDPQEIRAAACCSVAGSARPAKSGHNWEGALSLLPLCNLSLAETHTSQSPLAVTTNSGTLSSDASLTNIPINQTIKLIQ